MSIANQLKTNILDPTIFNQRRCEFRIPKGVYLSNIRLGNIGATIQGSSDPDFLTDKVRYPYHLGAFTLLQRIQLLNGNVQIAELNNVGDYLSFANQTRTNSNAFNMSRSLNRSNWGFEIENPTEDQKQTNLPTDSRKQCIKKIANTLNVVEDNENDTPKGWLDLSLVLPFLKSAPHLNCNELQDLRLVIEWVPIPKPPVPANPQNPTEQQQRDADMAFNEILTGISAVKTGALDTLRNLVIIQPTLLLDEIVDEASLKKN